MNILLLNHYAGSPSMGMEFRPYYMAREWVKMGHQVQIVAGDYSHLRIENRKIEEDFQKEVIEGIEYIWLRTGDYKGNGIKRALTMFRYVGKLWLNAKKIAKEWKPDVVICSSTYPLDTYAGQRIAKKAGAKLIHEIHDMWPVTLIEQGGMSKYHPFVMMMQMAENSFCRNADCVVSLASHAKEYLIYHGMKSEKFVHISNGVVKEEWEHSEPLPEIHKELFERLKKEGKFILCFFGSHTKSYALTNLIQAVQDLENPDIAVVFVGNGTQKEELKTLAKEKLEESFFFLPPVPKTIIPELLKYPDVLYVASIYDEIFRFGICMNKLFDSMMAGKPILYSVAAPNNYIEQYHCGISVTDHGMESLKMGIETLFSMTEEERKKMGFNGKRAILEHFTYEKLADQFAELF